jgi:3-hydroxybutyryl-CoA dehydrogenase
MKIVVITDETGMEELVTQGLQENVQVEWLAEPAAVPGAEAYIDLLFIPGKERLVTWSKIDPSLLLLNAVETVLAELPANAVRINGWTSLLKRPVVEAAAPQDLKDKTEAVFACFNKTVEWTPDIPGFVTARVLSMIINEAYFTLDEGVSTKEEIDTAMKLGTNYPYGPFDWSRIISLRKIHSLLMVLSATHPRYKPSALLEKEAHSE